MRLALAVSCIAATLPLAVATPAHAACATSSRTVTGTIAGADGRYVDVMLGFDLMRVSGSTVQHLDGRAGSSTYGCAGHRGYGATLRVNSNLPASGATSGGTKTWSIKVPSNVNQMIIEVYPKAAGIYGQTDYSRYGGALRWKIPIPYGQNINIRMPHGCNVGGKNGYIAGYAYKGGTKVKLDRIVAWSMGKDNNAANPILGFKTGTSESTGVFKILQLPPGQYYTVIFTYQGVSKQKYNIYVNPCKGTASGITF